MSKRGAAPRGSGLRLSGANPVGSADLKELGRATLLPHLARSALDFGSRAAALGLRRKAGWPQHCSVWKVPASGGEEVKVIDHTHTDAGWAVGKQGIYFFTPPDERGRSDLCLYKFATGKTAKILTTGRAVYARIAVPPDERTILYGQYDQAVSDLMLVENFH